MPTTILDGETYEQARHRRFTEEAKVIEKIQQDGIIRMAREACAPNQTFNSDEEWVKRFAALVTAHEREACAKVCDDLSAHYWEKDFPVESINCEECAAAIRARNNND